MVLGFAPTEKDLPELKESTFAEQILDYNEIEHPELFLYPDDNLEKFYTDPLKMFGMDKAVKLYLETIDVGEKVGVLVDDDADGFSSSASIVKLHKYYSGEDIEIIFHDQKSHGFSGEVEKIIESGIDLLIVPDAGSNDFEEQTILLEKGIKLLILDHHEIDEQNKILEMYEKYDGKYVLVNNQLDFNLETNKNLVGAGMVLKFAEALDEITQDTFSKELYDIVAMGQIGDSSNLADYEINYIVRKGLENITSPILKEVFNKQINNKDKIAPINLSFKIIPFINAVTRVGTREEKEMALKSLSSYWPKDEKIDVEKKRKNKITGKFNKVVEQWSHYEIAMDLMTKIKVRQNKEADKIHKLAANTAFADKICVAIIPEEDIKYRSITGLIANRLVQQFQMPALMLITNEDGTVSGSGRGYEKAFKSFRQWCLDTKKFELAQGHDNAFGVVINEEKLEKLKEEIVIKSDNSTEIIYEADKVYYNETNIEEIIMINDNQYLFGGDIKNPVFGYKDLVISRNSAHQRGSVVTFFHAGLEFIMYKQEPGIIDDFLMQLGFEQKLVVDLVGSASRSDFSGKVKDQIVLDDFDMRKYDPNDFTSDEESESEQDNKFLDKDGDLSF